MKPAPAVFLSADWRPEPTPMVIDAEKDYERASQGVYIGQALRGGSAGIFTADFRLKLKSNDDAKAEVVDSRLAEIPAHAGTL